METTNYRPVASGELCDVVVGNGLKIELFRSYYYTGNRDGLNGYRPAAVLKGNQTVWSFKSLDVMKGTYGELIEYGDDANTEFVIAVRDKHYLYDIYYRVNDFVHAVMVKKGAGAAIVGGSSVKDLLEIKLAIAESEDLFYSMTNKELGMKLMLDRAKREQEEAQAQAHRLALDEERSKQEAAAEEARQRAKRKQAEKVAEICARSKVHAFSEDGLKHFVGTPVYNDEEWKCLPDGKGCVLMKGNEPVEAFTVSKQHAKVKKTRQSPVTGKKLEPGKRAVENGPQAIGEQVVSIRGESRRVLVFPSMNEVRALRAAGLNSGTWVGVKKEGSTKIDIYAMNHGEIATVGVTQA